MRGKAHDENLFPLIFLSDHPVPRGGLTHERIPAFSSRPASHSSSSQSNLSGRYTSASPSSLERGRGKSEGQITTLFWTFVHFSARGHGPPVNPSRIQTHDPVSYMLWSQRDQSAERAA